MEDSRVEILNCKKNGGVEVHFKIVRNKYSVTNYQEFLERLEEMNQDGWILKRINSYWLTFVEKKKEDTEYLLDVFEQYFNLLRLKICSQDEFIENYTKEGYEHIGNIDSLFIFRRNGEKDSISQPKLTEKILESIKYQIRGEIFGVVIFLFPIVYIRLRDPEVLWKMYEMIITHRMDIIAPLSGFVTFGLFSFYKLCRLKKVRNIYESSSKMDEIIPTTNFSYSIFNLIGFLIGIAIFVDLIDMFQYL